jgi:hypothetical protein
MERGEEGAELDGEAVEWDIETVFGGRCSD